MLNLLVPAHLNEPSAEVDMEAIIFLILFIFMVKWISALKRAEMLKPFILASLIIEGPQGDRQIIEDNFQPDDQDCARMALLQLIWLDLARNYDSPDLSPARGKRLVAITGKGKKAFENGGVYEPDPDDEGRPPGFV